MTTPSQQNPTEILAAQLKLQENAYRLALQTRQDLNARLDAIDESIADLHLTALDNKPLKTIKTLLLSNLIAVSLAGLWVISYLLNTISGTDEILLWKFVTSEEYGVSGNEILFVMLARFIVGYSASLAGSAIILLFIDALGNFFNAPKLLKKNGK